MVHQRVLMPKISILGQNFGIQAADRQTHTDRQTDTQTEKVNTEDPFFDFFKILIFF